jgi:hypothetical protein
MGSNSGPAASVFIFLDHEGDVVNFFRDGRPYVVPPETLAQQPASYLVGPEAGRSADGNPGGTTVSKDGVPDEVGTPLAPDIESLQCDSAAWWIASTAEGESPVTFSVFGSE